MKLSWNLSLVTKLSLWARSKLNSSWKNEPEPAINLKPLTSQQNKKHLTSMSCTPEPVIQPCDTGLWIPLKAVSWLWQFYVCERKKLVLVVYYLIYLLWAHPHQFDESVPFPFVADKTRSQDSYHPSWMINVVGGHCLACMPYFGSQRSSWEKIMIDWWLLPLNV